MNKRFVFITGANGFIGRALCTKMIENGCKVKGVFRKTSEINTLPAGIEKVYLDSIDSCNFIEQDFSGVDAVVHLAACAHVMKDFPDSLETFRKINVQGTQRLAQIAAKSGVKRFIFISTVKVNGEENSERYAENDIPAPRDAYGKSKLEAEYLLARIARETGMEVVILRPPLVYGPGVRANFENLIKIACCGLPLPFKNIRNLRSFIYLGNLVDAISICITHPSAAGETFMLSDGHDISTPDLIKIIASAMHAKPFLFSLRIDILEILCKIMGRGKDIKKLTATLLVDSSKIRNMLGWHPPFSIEEGIRETIKYYNSC